MARPTVRSARFDFTGGVNSTFSEDILDTTELRRAKNGRPVYGGYEKVLGGRRIHEHALGPTVPGTGDPGGGGGGPIPPGTAYSDGGSYSDGGAWSAEAIGSTGPTIIDLLADGTFFADGQVFASGTTTGDDSGDDDETSHPDGARPVTGVRQWDSPVGRETVALCDGRLYTKQEGDTDFLERAAGLSILNRAKFAPYRYGSTISLLIADGNLWSWNGFTLVNLTATVGAPAATDVVIYKTRTFVITGDSKTVYWSEFGDPTKWTPVNGGGFADIETYDTDPLTGLWVVGGSLLLFKQENISRYTGVDASDVQIDTGTEGVSSNIGCVAPHTLAPLGETMVAFLAATGPHAATEAGVAEIGTKINREFDFANRAEWSKAVAVRYDTRHEVWFWFPPSSIESENSTAWVYNEQLQNWTGPVVGKATASACEYESADGTSSFLRGTYKGWVVREQLEGLSLDDVRRDGTLGTAIEMALELPPLLFGDAGALKTLVGRQSVDADLGSAGELVVGWGSELGSGSVTIPTKGVGVRNYAFRLQAKGRRIILTLTDGTTALTKITGISLVAHVGATQSPRERGQ